jgi:hypothetical protein
MIDETYAPANIECSCYGCTITRKRAGLPVPDRRFEPCSPPDACASGHNCWTHSKWTDELAARRERS